ncbi:MAG: nucleotidyltransferase substrate binding protein (TIGR01987 family) [Rickettsiales bacterium]|jgi:nucleotidyltransferase substrate binding protein (TIGR01987 family)
MNNEIDLVNLEKSLKTLIEGFEKFKNSKDKDLEILLEDGCIQRFEYVIDIAWKTMKKFLKVQYGKSEEELTVNNIFRLMQGFELINNWEDWKGYYQKRNESSHEYNIEKSRAVIVIIPKFINDANLLLKNLKTELLNN